MSESSDIIVKKRACHLCEAICGIELHLRGDEIVAIKGDPDDPLSQGHICPKAVALQDLHSDPKRLRKPVKRIGSGDTAQWQKIDWDEAYQLVIDGLMRTIDSAGTGAVGVYAGNPNVHNYGCITHQSQFFGPIRTQNRFSATSVDQLPHHLIAYWMFGHQFLLPIPDIDHSDYFLMLGANPMASNGSIMTVPNFPGRLKALQARGGKLVVVDPRRTETAEKADAHHFIRPGSDAALLSAIVHVLYRDGLVDTGDLSEHLDGLDGLEDRFQAFSPQAVSKITGMDAAVIEGIAHDFAKAPSAVCYGRMGCSTQAFGALCQWLTQLINILTGNLDRRGGAMFTSPALDLIGNGTFKPGNFDRFRSRSSNLPEFSGELPASSLAGEITTPGEGQVRALVTTCGNPVVSTPAGDQLIPALEGLDFMASIDLYINETTRHADVILPSTSPLEHDHFDLVFHHFAVRNTVKYSQPVFDKPEGSRHDWEIFTELGERLCKAMGQEPRPSMPPADIVDFGLQMGEHKLSLADLKAKPEGIDLGPLQPCFPERLQTPNKRVQCLPERIPADLERLARQLQEADEGLLLIGRRHVRSNNSWMHQFHRLIKGKNRCTVMMHPNDASAAGLKDGEQAEVSSRVGKVRLPVEITDTMMPGTVSIPHGYGHGGTGFGQQGQGFGVNAENSGVSVNDLVPSDWVDPLSGNAAVNGVPVSVAAA